MRAIWTTDIHLDSLDDGISPAVFVFLQSLFKSSPDAVIITGDITTATDIERHLSVIESVASCPVYFVCGNHDFYNGEISHVRSKIQELTSRSKKLCYLSRSGVHSLTPHTAIVGHDGWYDGYLGDPQRTSFLMRDWFRISEFINAGATTQFSGMYSGGQSVNLGVCLSVARKLAAEAAEHVAYQASEAAKTHSSVVIATHVPPWEDAHVHNTTKGEIGAIPWYTSKLMGAAIEKVASRHPSVDFTVLCGHTHSQKSLSVSHNLVCHVAPSEYGAPVYSTVVIK
jgi:Calcineurin-like phosphoesterase